MSCERRARISDVLQQSLEAILLSKMSSDFWLDRQTFSPVVTSAQKTENCNLWRPKPYFFIWFQNSCPNFQLAPLLAWHVPGVRIDLRCFVWPPNILAVCDISIECKIAIWEAQLMVVMRLRREKQQFFIPGADNHVFPVIVKAECG